MPMPLRECHLPKLAHLIKAARRNDFRGRLLAVDPGETTGVSLLDVGWDGVKLQWQAQIETWPVYRAVLALDDLIKMWPPTMCIHEAYHVYKWKLQEHSFSEVPTIQIIGALRTLCILNSIPYESQTAQTGKAFFTDKRLKSLDMFFQGEPHARDSLRHAAQYLVFGLKPTPPPADKLDN